jgi:3-deoxy-D-manno-octulosonate 8-phosphate phosphatase (KDO 8-P phosphatase)
VNQQTTSHAQIGPQPNSSPADIRLLILDCDGVLTDGSIVYDNNGNEIKAFNVRDGLGLRVWMRHGGLVAIVTGRGGAALQRRAAELGVSTVLEGVSEKAAAVRTLCEQLGVDPTHAAAMGDDWPDLAMFASCGYAIAPADAHSDVKAMAQYVTAARGGHGAVREAIEHLLSSKGLLSKARDQVRGTDAK